MSTTVKTVKRYFYYLHKDGENIYVSMSVKLQSIGLGCRFEYVLA